MLLAVAVAFSAACKKNANTGNTATSNAGGTTTTTTGGGAGTSASSPTAALRAYYEAGMKKDRRTHGHPDHSGGPVRDGQSV